MYIHRYLIASFIFRYTAQPEDSEKPKGSIQWVPAEASIEIEIRVYNHLFTVEEPSDMGWEGELNPDSEIIYSKAKVDPSILKWNPVNESSFQVSLCNQLYLHISM
jgi:glutaminyl-tRNA synthetase